MVDRPRRYFNDQFESTKQEVRLQTVDHAQRQRRELTGEVLAVLGRLEARAQVIEERLDRIERAQVEAQATADHAVAVVAAALRDGRDGRDADAT